MRQRSRAGRAVTCGRVAPYRSRGTARFGSAAKPIAWLAMLNVRALSVTTEQTSVGEVWPACDAPTPACLSTTAPAVSDAALHPRPPRLASGQCRGGRTSNRRNHTQHGIFGDLGSERRLSKGVRRAWTVGRPHRHVCAGRSRPCNVRPSARGQGAVREMPSPRARTVGHSGKGDSPK